MRWKNDWRLQDAAARAQFGERPRDALALARFGTRATGGAEGKAARASHGDYQDMCGHVLREVQAKGHPTICGWGKDATHREVADTFADALVGKRAAEVTAFKATLRKRHKDAAVTVDNGITDSMRAAWADEADRLERARRDEAIHDTSLAVPEFDWGGIIREESEIRDAVREKYADNPLGVATGPGA